MPDVYDRIADSFIDSSKAVSTLYPKPKPAAQRYPFADYLKEQMPKEEVAPARVAPITKPPTIKGDYALIYANYRRTGGKLGVEDWTRAGSPLIPAMEKRKPEPNEWLVGKLKELQGIPWEERVVEIRKQAKEAGIELDVSWQKPVAKEKSFMEKWEEVGEAVIGVSKAPLFKVGGVPISAGDIAGLTLIAFGIHQVGSTGWNMLLDKVLRRPGDLNVLGKKLTRVALNREMSRWSKQTKTPIPKEARNRYISKYLNDMASAWERAVGGQAKSGVLNAQALQKTSSATYAQVVNNVSRDFGGLVPKATQTGAMAMGGVPKVPFVITTAVSQQLSKLGYSTQAISQITPAVAQVVIKQGIKAPVTEVPAVPEVLDKAGSPIEGLRGQPIELNPDGTITLFHRTTPEIAERIRQTGKFITPTPKEEVFFSNFREGQATGFGDAIIEIRIKPENVTLDDAFPGGEVHVSAIPQDIISKGVIAKPPAVPPPPAEPPAPPVTPPTPPVPPTIPEPIPVEDPVSKLTRLIRSAKPIRKETELLKHEELRRRVAKAAGVLQKGEAREAFLRSKGALRGVLPQAEFEPLEVGLTPADLAGLFNRIRDSKEIPYFQKLNTSEALEKLLLGELPTRGDISLLEQVFGVDLAKAIMGKRPMSQKAWDLFLEIWNIPRTLIASGEISASLRQGAFLAPSHFRVWGRSFKAQLRALSSGDTAREIDRAIRTGPNAERKSLAGLYHAPLEGVGASLTAREEVYVSTLLQRFAGWWERTGILKKAVTAPLYPIAKGVQISERAYITMLNKLRSDGFDSIAADWEKAGYEATVKDDKELAKFLNNATGRGSLGKLEESAPFLSGMFFSPRLQASLIRRGESLLTGTAPVRKEFAKTLVAFVGAGLLILGLARLAGAEVGDNPLSADFGKIKIGKTRIDIWGGFQQYARFISTLIMGMKKSTITGQTYEANRLDIIQQFGRSKLMPTVSFGYDLLKGRTYIGEKMELDIQQAYQRLAPMFAQDMVDAIEAEGLIGVLIASPGALGIGIVSYDLPSWPELEGYFNIEDTVDSLGRVTKTATAKRLEYRKANPENEAKLFILGRFTTLKTPAAAAAVLRLMEEHKIKPKDIRGYENVFGPDAKPITEAGAKPITEVGAAYRYMPPRKVGGIGVPAGTFQPAYMPPR